MNWLALSPLEVAIVWSALAAAALWLYLHHRRPQHRRVSTLRFWASVQPISQPRRRKLREPWAFLAQILFLLLLILALANLRWGPAFVGRNVAIVLDTSVWSEAHPADEPPWIDRERSEALRLLDSLPGGDRVLLLRADPDAPPILALTTDREALRRAILNVQPSSVTADIPRALTVGRAALGQGRRGLLVYIGPGLVDSEQARRLDEFRSEVESADANSGQPQFLVRLVGDWTALKNRGITRLSLRRDAAQPDRWHLLTQLKNYSKDKTDLTLSLSVGGEPLGQRKISLGPGALANAEEEFTWDKGGLLQAEISPADDLDADNRARVNLPTFRTVRVAVFTSGVSPTPFVTDLLTVLSSNPYVQTQLVPPGASASIFTDVAIHQGANVPAQPDYNSVWFIPGTATAGSRPVRVTGWNSQHPVTRWVRTRDISVRNPAPLKLQAGDTVLAYADGDPPSPLILAREVNGHRVLILGFDSHDSNLPLESAFPLLMAGSIEWMTHSVDEVADSLPAGELDLPGPASKIISPSGAEVPFARKGVDLHFLALETGVYRAITPSGEKPVPVNLPALPAQRMELTSAERAAPESEPLPPAAWNLWRWLVLLAIAALWMEWKLYYSARERQQAAEARETPGDPALAVTDDEVDAREESEFRNPKFVGR
jgi:Ca-activated chloride channel homolog